MPVFKKDKTKKKSIPKKQILKEIKDQEYVDLGEPFGESARRYLAFQIMKMIDQQEISGTVITPEGVYIAMTTKEVKDVVRLIKAKGICNLEEISKENNWNSDSVKLIAKTRVNLIQRKDGQIITLKTAKELFHQKILAGLDVDIYEIAEELQIKKSIAKDLLDSLLADGKIDGVYVKSTHKFLPSEMLEESLMEYIEQSEEDNQTEIPFSTIAEEYNIPEDRVYNLLLKLYNSGDIDVQLNLGKKICYLTTNIERIKYEEKVPEEERKLEIEDLTEKD